jgi:hypothetical protein
MVLPLAEQAGGGTSSTLRSGTLLIERDEGDALLVPARRVPAHFFLRPESYVRCHRPSPSPPDEWGTVDRRSGRAVEVELKVTIPPVFVLALR